MRIDVVTIFPAYFDVLDLSLLGKARRDGVLDLAVHDLRDFTHDRHRTVDDTPYGGGPGMLMQPEPWGAALDQVRDAHDRDDPALDDPALDDPALDDPVLVVPTPAGEQLTHELAESLAGEPWLVFACGRYEGIDARVAPDAARHYRVREVSLGDYVVNGGEVAALAVIEAVGRLLPGVVGNEGSLTDESHVAGLLEAPAYTKPSTWRGREVPEVLLSGNHAAIARWRRDASLRRTAQVRPDLIARLDPEDLDSRDLEVLADCGWRADDGRFLASPPPVAD
jgi:tRNA (guanine37-N1)-methyltransferase